VLSEISLVAVAVPQYGMKSTKRKYLQALCCDSSIDSLLDDDDDDDYDGEASTSRLRPLQRRVSAIPAHRRSYAVPGFTSPWQDYLTDEALVEDSLLGEEFREQFGIPRAMFDEILADLRADLRQRKTFVCPEPGHKEVAEWARANCGGWFVFKDCFDDLPDDEQDTIKKTLKSKGCPFAVERLFDDKATRAKMARRPTVHSDALKLLGHLYMIRFGVPPKAVTKAAGICRRTMAEFHRRFPSWHARRYYEQWVTPPKNVMDLRRVERIFAKLGFPGAGCLADGTHIGTDVAPAPFRAGMVGKEGHPTYGFNVTCGPDTWVYGSTPPFPGSHNDKSLVKHDEVLKRMRTDAMYTEYTYNVFRADGSTQELTGVYSLVDNGYQRWKTLIAPWKVEVDTSRVKWSTRLESVRKIVECLFGRLKRRWGILKKPLTVASEEWVWAMWQELLTWHNMLLKYDGYTALGDGDDDFIPAPINDDDIRAANRAELALLDVDDDDYENGFDELRMQLVTHYKVQRERGEVFWIV